MDKISFEKAGIRVQGVWLSDLHHPPFTELGIYKLELALLSSGELQVCILLWYLLACKLEV